MKVAVRLLVGASLMALVVLLFFPIYIEPGNGNINCGRAWAPSPMEDFLADDCGDAVASRRIQLGITAVAVVIGSGGLIFIRSSRTT